MYQVAAAMIGSSEMCAIELVEIKSIEQCLDPEIRERARASSKARHTKHLLARQGAVELGFISIDVRPTVDYLVVYELFVTSCLRGFGRGQKLLREVECLATSYGYARVTLTPSPLDPRFPSSRLTAWYKRQGYARREDCPSELEKSLSSQMP